MSLSDLANERCRVYRLKLFDVWNQSFLLIHLWDISRFHACVSASFPVFTLFFPACVFNTNIFFKLQPMHTRLYSLLIAWFPASKTGRTPTRVLSLRTSVPPCSCALRTTPCPCPFPETPSSHPPPSSFLAGSMLGGTLSTETNFTDILLSPVILVIFLFYLDWC